MDISCYNLAQDKILTNKLKTKTVMEIEKGGRCGEKKAEDKSTMS